VKSLGDGTMSSFPSPEQGLRAAQAILRATEASDGPAIALRIGIHTGEVIQTREDFFGTVVNKAARIAAAAGPGEILISEALHLIAGGAPGDALAEPVSLFLKGFEGEHAVFRLAVDE
ncbi:MAG TPA: guanylate cyclase, partial [Ruegeria sp.]|nr:guanylate cyclase [Ruegeria sp.]